MLGWSLWWKLKVKTLFQTTVKWDLDNITAKSYPEGRYGNEQRNDMYRDILMSENMNKCYMKGVFI